MPASSDIEYVYSNEHFAEISRSEDERFFGAIRRLQARIIDVSLDEHNNFTDQGFLHDYMDPEEAYLNYKKTLEDVPVDAVGMFRDIQVLMNGNKETLSPSEISENFVKTLGDLIGDIDLPEGLDFVKAPLINQVESIAMEFEKTLSKHIPDIKPLEEMRKAMSPHLFSGLDPANGLILDQIWQEIQLKMNGVSKEQFYGHTSQPGNQKWRYSKYGQVIHLHGLLNFLGYWPDKGLNKMNKITGINSDASHLAHAILCNGILSADKRLCMKATAIYKYLGLNTSVLRLDFRSKNTD